MWWIGSGGIEDSGLELGRVGGGRSGGKGVSNFVSSFVMLPEALLQAVSILQWHRVVF